MLAGCVPIAAALDGVHGGTSYREALASAEKSLREPEVLPSARVLATLREDFDGSYVRFVHAQSVQTRNAQLALPYPQALRDRFDAMAAQSLVDQAAAEHADTLPFEVYRQQYLATERLGKYPQTRGGAATL